jgi:hypothetical protein
MGVMLEYGGKTAELATIGAAVCSFSFLPFLTFAQILKLYERMRFLNFKQGDRLTAFLDKIASILGKNEKQNATEFWSNSNKYTGKLAEYQIKMFLDSTFIFKLVVFYTLWVARWILSDIFENMWMRKRAIPGICKMIFFVRKLHFAFLNILLLDTFFYGTHALLHFNIYNPNMNYLLSILNMVLVTLDMLRVLKVCLSVDKADLSFLLMKKYNYAKS